MNLCVKTLLLLGFASALTYMGSCGSKGEKPQDQNNEETGNNNEGGTGSGISYVDTIRPIVSTNCSGVSCHSVGGAQPKKYADRESDLIANAAAVIQRINYARSNPLVMPPDANLTEAEFSALNEFLEGHL
jgi:hypothetical protein